MIYSRDTPFWSGTLEMRHQKEWDHQGMIRGCKRMKERTVEGWNYERHPPPPPPSSFLPPSPSPSLPSSLSLPITLPSPLSLSLSLSLSHSPSPPPPSLPLSQIYAQWWNVHGLNYPCSRADDVSGIFRPSTAAHQNSSRRSGCTNDMRH